MAKSLTITTPEQMRQLGAGLGAIVRAGDVLVLTGDLGAGKTTLTQGLGQALGARGRITSPTYTISRLHPTAAGPTLAHVDAYRVTDMWDFETIDLEALIPTAITVIEWGEALIEALDIPYLHLTITRDDGTDELSDMGERRVTFQTHGDRWAQRIDLHQLQAVLEAMDT
ncbi:MAG: tRNA (adenosine(37)-N6)-threonylcarbamoyltransferase complex ATPase subunit type 1 TsaE [Bowdeniella nasicola]|nr:tRNA (adenosine(37)-N6)-threonylcarbamoyltransferase complex ATPase subunit type 1 TsaE [Bowdeniella nasicola]